MLGVDLFEVGMRLATREDVQVVVVAKIVHHLLTILVGLSIALPCLDADVQFFADEFPLRDDFHDERVVGARYRILGINDGQRVMAIGDVARAIFEHGDVVVFSGWVANPRL